MQPSAGAAARLGGAPAAQFVTQPPLPLDLSDEVDSNLPLLPVIDPLTSIQEGTVPPSPADPISTRYTVAEGDTLGDVAERFGISLQTLIWANSLEQPDQLEVGLRLTVPLRDGFLYGVQSGDTLMEVANDYSANLRQIIDVNGLQPPYMLLIGQPLLLPGGHPPAPRPSVDQSGPEQVDAATISESLPEPPDASTEQASFILQAAKAARASQRETGVPASVSIAQAILESNWGASRLAQENANYFGIKALGKEGTAGVVWYDTWEMLGGQNVTLRAPFRAYRELADSFIDHGRFFLENPRYNGALAVRSAPREFAREISQAGYATDSAYARKLIGYMDRFNLYAYDLGSD
jgi:LysM repeat protein